MIYDFSKIDGMWLKWLFFHSVLFTAVVYTPTDEGLFGFYLLNVLLSLLTVM